MWAQTNVRLFSQLLEQVYSDDDLGSVFSAYELGVQLFTGRFQPSGNPLISHLVRTASILAGSFTMSIIRVFSAMVDMDHSVQSVALSEMRWATWWKITSGDTGC
jgi:(p)ppGpp synthase/HD superfamily hydrolase